jgi:multidrug resistance efflux pump
MKMRGKWLLIGGVTVLACIAAATFTRYRRLHPAPAPAPARKVDTNTGEIALSGKIRAAHVVAVGTPAGGTITAFLADAGQEVEAGQLLATVASQGLETGREVATVALNNAQTRVTRIEAQVMAARLEASRTQAAASRASGELARTEKGYTRQKFLHGEGATPRLAYERSAREFEAAQADSSVAGQVAKQADDRVQTLLDDLRAARKVLDDRQKQLEDAASALSAADLHSPVDGIVVARKGEVGKVVPEASGDLFEIATDTLALQVAVEPEPPALQRIKPGQPALVYLSDFQTEGIPGTVAAIKDTVVLVEFNSPNPAIKPGLAADVRIKLGESGAAHGVK